MGSIILYLIFILIGLCTGIAFWIIRKYAIPGVISFILALFAPLFMLLVSAQRGAGVGVYTYIKDEVSAGNTWARFLVVMHVYLIIWLLFLAVRGIIHLIQSQTFKEKVKKVREKFHRLNEQMIQNKDRK